jgi:hypothetical protein
MSTQPDPSGPVVTPEELARWRVDATAIVSQPGLVAHRGYAQTVLGLLDALAEVERERDALLVARDGIVQQWDAPDGWPPETRDCEDDEMYDTYPEDLEQADDDETAARAARGARAH